MRRGWTPPILVAIAVTACTTLLLIGVSWFPAVAASALSDSGAGEQPAHYGYCVVGGGPGGIQAGYFLHQLGMDYVVFEANDRAGSFFARFPRQRRLISINKFNTGTDDKEFNLRHDWNSLLTDVRISSNDFPPEERHHIANDDEDNHRESTKGGAAAAEAMQEEAARRCAGPTPGRWGCTPRIVYPRNYSREYYPHADTLVAYFTDFANAYGLHVQYGRRVTIQGRLEGSAAGATAAGKGPFVLHLHPHRRGVADHNDHDAPSTPPPHPPTVVLCEVVILATGKAIPFVPGRRRRVSSSSKPSHSPPPGLIQGERWVTGYEVASTNPADYENKDVLIIGNGNSALELAQSIESYAASVHLTSRHVMQMSWQTHYVGHARAKNLGILDRYQLKSLDALIAHGPNIEEMYFFHDPVTKRIRVAPAEGAAAAAAASPGGRIAVQAGDGTFALRRGYHTVVRCLGFTWDHTVFTSPTAAPPTAAVAVIPRSNDCGAAGRPDGTDGEKQREGAGCGANYSVVPLAPPAEDRGGRYLQVASNFEAVSVPNLFVAGSLSHFRDHKKSAGGFIHGFRYLARTTTYYLRERYGDFRGLAAARKASGPTSGNHDPSQLLAPRTVTQPFPHTILASPPTAPSLAIGLVEQLTRFVVGRLRNVSSLYQMQGVLCDVFLVTNPEGDDRAATISAEHGREVRYVARSQFRQQQPPGVGDDLADMFPEWSPPHRPGRAVRYVSDLPLDQLRSLRSDLTNIHLLQRQQAAVNKEATANAAEAVEGASAAESSSRRLLDSSAYYFASINLEFGRDFQGSGVISHQSQEETDHRQREKKLWDRNTDPDVLLGRVTDGNESSSGGVLVDHDPSEEERGQTPKWTLQGASMDFSDELKPLKRLRTRLDDPFQQPTMKKKKKKGSKNQGDREGGKGADDLGDSADGDDGDAQPYGYNFLHPVLRLWKRRACPSPPNCADHGATLGPPVTIVDRLHLREDVHNEWTLADVHLPPLRTFLKSAIARMLGRQSQR